MKRFSKSELQEKAKEEFERLKVNKLYATSDGQFFILENRAQLHAGKNLTVYKLENENPAEENTGASEDDGKDSVHPLTIKALTEKVAGIENLEELQVLLHEEVGGPNRVGAVKVIEGRITKLTE